MEDYAPILWILFIGATMLISAISKANEAKKRTAKNTRQQAEMQIPETEFPQESVQPAHMPEQTEQNVRQSLFETREATRPTQPKTTGKVATKAPEATIITEPILQESPTEGEGVDFELRKAIIYSEILKPKFEEE